jgi:hypothetical protein
MAKNRIYKRIVGVVRGSLFFSLVMPFVISSNAGAVDIVNNRNWQNTLEAQGTYNFARREIFRDLYGNGITLSLRYERTLNNRCGLGFRISRVQLSNAKKYAIAKLAYRDFTVAPVITYSFFRTGCLRVFSGGGAGLSFRKITLDSYVLDDSGNPLYQYEAHQTETSWYGLLVLGVDINLSSTLFAGARATYDRHFFNDATKGDFGDTGGFNFGGSLGFGF